MNAFTVSHLHGVDIDKVMGMSPDLIEWHMAYHEVVRGHGKSGGQGSTTDLGEFAAMIGLG